MSLTARAIILALIVAAAMAGWWRLTAHYDNRGYQRAQTEAKAAADAQTERNRELQRAAEKRYIVTAQTRDRFFVTTVREIRDAAAPLAACPLPDDVRRLLNHAAECARGDSPAACGPAVQVPLAR